MEDGIERQIKDIQDIEFGDTIDDITSSLLIITTLYEFNDNEEVIKVSKKKLQEGIHLLRKMGATDIANEYSK